MTVESITMSTNKNTPEVVKAAEQKSLNAANGNDDALKKEAEIAEAKTEVPVVDKRASSAPETPEAPKSPESTKAPETPLDKKTVTPEMIQPFADEFLKDGKLSEDSYKKLEELGVPKWAVDDVIEGRLSKAQRSRQEVLGVLDADVTKADQMYNTLIDWAGKTFSDQEVETFNKAISNNDPSVQKLAIENLRSRFERARGSISQTIVSGESTAANGGSQSSGDSFKSFEELREAQKDPRYAKNSYYRQEVERKAAKLFAKG